MADAVIEARNRTRKPEPLAGLFPRNTEENISRCVLHLQTRNRTVCTLWSRNRLPSVRELLSHSDNDPI